VDPITRHDLQTEFRALTEQLEKTVVFVTHDVGEALLLGDRIVVLEQGRIAFIGDVNDFRASQDDVVRAFRGDRELR
jgi:osmoprotectant transport system ATP-binding protein